jgi:hypothetical protein
MTERKPLLQDGAAFLSARRSTLPDHVFRIGEGGEAHVGQLPNLRAMAFHVIGKAPVPLAGGHVDTLGMGPYALGSLIGDAHLKLMRPWPGADDGLFHRADAGYLQTIADGMVPLSPMADAVRAAFLYRVGEFMDVALHRPAEMPEIIARLDTLTNERLTDRARAILETGIDPGAADLWPCAPDAPDEVTVWIGAHLEPGYSKFEG